MLTPEMRKHIENDWERIPPEELKTYLYRLRGKIKQTLKDLALVTKKLPEDQLEQVITAETLDPFLSALLLPKYKRERDGETQRRKFEIAASMMQSGIVKCLESLPHPYYNDYRKQARQLIDTLSHAATGHWLEVDPILYVEKGRSEK